VGSLALVGVPPFAGFWSKDAILASALARGDAYGWILLVTGLFGAFLTGIYTFRLFFVVFYGEPSDLVLEHAEGHGDHAHGPEESTAHGAHGHREGPWSMVLSVVVLTVLSAVGGLLEIAGVWHPFGHWLAQVVEPLVEPTTAQDWGTSAVTVGVGLAGVWIAWAIYRTGRLSVPALPAVQRLFEHKFYFDELYDAIAYRPAQVLAARLHSDVETPLVEGSLEEIGRVGREVAVDISRVQSGLLRSYALAIAVSAVALAVVFIAVR
jgi:NADH-quinone oxidoreductase subunit L